MNFDRGEPTSANRYQNLHAHLILDSHRHFTQRLLLPADNEPAGWGRRLYEAPFVVLAHDSAADPVFFYANLAAQRLFEMPWHQIVQLHSRLSAEPLAQEERQGLLERVSCQGWINDYSGIRISATGKRFRVTNATVWNLVNDNGDKVGQAASFSNWTTIDR